MTNDEPISKIIRIFSPISGMQFKIELNDTEKNIRELLGTILQINPSSIKGIKDSYNNYYTLSSALNSRIINTNQNNLYTVITENNFINETNKNIYSMPNMQNLYYSNNPYIHDDNVILRNNIINSIQNIQNFRISKIRNNFMGNNFKIYNKIEYYQLINFLYKNNYIDNKNYYKLKKCIDINNQDVLEIMKPFIEYDDNYDKLINNLFPILNLDLSVNDRYNTNNNNLNKDLKYNNYKYIINNLKEYFSSDNIKELNYLLLMENIEILKIFKIYSQTGNKILLINSLSDLLKKISKLNIWSKSNNCMSRIINHKKSKSQNYHKISKKSNNFMNNIHNNKSSKNNTKENKELLNTITDKIIDYGKKFSKDIYYLMKQELNNMSEENKTSLFSSKFKFNLNKKEKNDFSLNSAIKKNIKNYYNKYIQNNIYSYLDEEEKKLYENIIKQKNTKEYKDLIDIYKEMLKNDKFKNKLELLRNKIINYLKKVKEQKVEESKDVTDEENEERKEKDKSSSKESEEGNNIINIEENEEEDDEEEEEEKEDKKEKNEEKESSMISSTVMDVEEENYENYSEESGVSIRKADRPRKH